MIPAIIEAALRSLLVAAAVWAGLRVLRVTNVLAQKAAWGLVLAAAVLMPVVMHWQLLPAGAVVVLRAHPLLQALGGPVEGASPTSRATFQPSQALSPAPGTTVYRAEPVSTGVSHFPAPAISSSPQTVGPSPTSRQPAAPARQRLQPAEMALLFYLAVSGCLLLRLLFGLGSALKLWFKAEPVPMRSLPVAYVGLAYGLRLRSSRDLSSPVTIGSGVVLPNDYTEWDSGKLRIVLAHERSHVRQGDFYIQTLAGLYAILFWFSPLGWWLKRKLSDLSETISDRAGLREAASRSIYAQILLEFAVAPRPTLQGVAMARSSNVSTRIERLLNDATFRQAFVGGRRAFVAVLLVPVALVIATALIRVDAAGQASSQPTPQAAPQAQPEVQARPDEAPDAATAPEAAEPTDPEVRVYGVPPAPMPPNPPGLPALPAVTPLPPLPPGPAEFEEDQNVSTSSSSSSSTSHGHGKGNRYNYSYSYNSNGGDSYAIVKGDREHVNFSGDWQHGRKEDLEKARKVAHGDFLWFTRDNKSYVVEDPAILAQIDDLYKPMEALGKQQEELGRQQEKLGEQQERLGRQQEQASVPTPDISKEMAELNASMAKLQSKMGKTVTQEELADLEGKLGELQGRLGALQGEMGAKQGVFGSQQGRLGGMQGELGARQGKIGAEQGRLAQEADRKVKSIIDQSLQNGKARPVQ
jgi:hypothetical protein